MAETRELLLDEVDRMSRLVEDLILLAKTERPGFLSPEPVDAAALTEAVLAKAAGLGERAGRSTRRRVTVAVDPQRITQALLQLAHNAVKHTGAGDVVAFGSVLDGDSVLWWVRDTGPGVAPADRDRIFERFGRGGEADERDRRLRSRPGHRGGHRARPRRCRRLDDDYRDGAPSWCRSPRPPARTTRPHPDPGAYVARILIVEDEARIAGFIAKGLRAEGHTTTVAVDGRAGLDEALSGITT